MVNNITYFIFAILLSFTVGCGADESERLTKGQPLECQQDCSMENYRLYIDGQNRIFKTDGQFIWVSLNAKLSDHSDNELEYFIENWLDNYFENYVKIEISSGDIYDDTDYKNKTEKNFFTAHPSSFNMEFERR